MSSRKRSAGTSSSTPAASSKQPRVGDGDGVTPATANAANSRPHGRVVLDVGGQRFVSSRSTLEGSSSYFQALLARWDEDTDEPVFIDCDADAFGVLLSHMRIASNLILPANDYELCARVLLLAEYLGMDGLLATVKSKAYKNLHPDAELADGTDVVAAFETEVGTLQEAIESEVLPARFFTPVPKPPPEPPERVVKTLIPAPVGYKAIFGDHMFFHEQAVDEDGERDPSETRDVLSFAVVELRDGTTHVEAVVQRSLESTSETPVHHNKAHPQLQNHLQFASDVLFHGEPWKHHLIVPPPAGTNMLPVAPGTIRAVWAKPAITKADIGKDLTITESGAIIVGGEVRAVTWGDRPIPSPIKDKRIQGFLPDFDGIQRSRFKVIGTSVFQHVPYLTGSSNQTTRDVAFVELRSGGDKEFPARFYIADSQGPKVHVYDTNRLVDVTRVKVHNGMEFSHTITAS